MSAYTSAPPASPGEGVIPIFPGHRHARLCASRFLRRPSHDPSAVSMLLHRPAQRLDLARAAVAQRDEHHLILIEMDEIIQPAPQAHKVCSRQSAKKNGILLPRPK